jgi:hypothetical protein
MFANLVPWVVSVRCAMQSRNGPRLCLVGVENEESDHEGEQSGSFGEGKAQNGIREKLTCTVPKVVSSLHTCSRVRLPQD